MTFTSAPDVTDPVRPMRWVRGCSAAWVRPPAGHEDLILCLGCGQAMVKDFFLNYREMESDDFVMCAGQVELLDSDMSD